MTPTSFIDEMAETYLNRLTLFSRATHYSTVFSMALHKSSYTCPQLKRPIAICGLSSRYLWINLRRADGDNKSEQHEGRRGSRCVWLRFSVNSTRGGWRGLVCHSQCRNLALAEMPYCNTPPWPCECVSESARLINIWAEPRDKQGYIRDGGLIFFWLASGMSVTLVSLVDS